MKHLFLTVILLFAITVPALCDEIPLSYNGDGNEITHNSHKAPHLQQAIPTATYENNLGYISFTCGSDCEAFLVTIEDENGTVVLTDSVHLEAGTVSILSVAQLPAGNYTLYIEVNGLTYSGHFSI